MRRDHLRRLFGMVLQDAWLFSGTIRDNIAYGREGATEEQIQRRGRGRSRRPLCADPARRLRHSRGGRFHQPVAGRTTALITIARAFSGGPADLLISIEATSSVDTRTEVLIQRAMAGLLKGRTSFVIAHRLSTIREADIILVMNQGSSSSKGRITTYCVSGASTGSLYNSQFTEALDPAC